MAGYHCLMPMAYAKKNRNLAIPIFFFGVLELGSYRSSGVTDKCYSHFTLLAPPSSLLAPRSSKLYFHSNFLPFMI